MMKKIVLIILLSTWVYATSAYDGDITFKQADGTVFQGHLKGDEWFNWIESSSGDIIKYNIASKNYEYAEITVVDGKNQLIPSGDKVDAQTTNTRYISQDTLNQIWEMKRTKSFSHKTAKKSCH